jgi:uncharacterized sporulation protein YeaH/YhbH (DUF444 family)
MNSIIDRRPNQGQKNLGNRQRFLRRSKEHIKRAIRDNIQDRSISDTNSGERIKIPVDTIREPTFGHNNKSGINRRVLPGNKDFVPQDTIDRPKGGGGKGRGKQASNSDETFEDEFSFALTKDEFYDLLFEDLELPDMVKKQLKKTNTWEIKREGISTAGNPSNLNVIRTMKQSLGRRIILRKPNERLIADLEAELQDCSDERRTAIEAELEILRKKVRAVSYVDPIDLRYNVFNRKQVPSTTAVMICVMDVSGSMDEHKKDVAKRFFMLLYLFLQKKYEQVIIEFVRHHTSAERVNEETFFYDKLSGGTMVSSALELTEAIIQQDYNPSQYNIYVCQASDGDNYDSDNQLCRDLLINNLLPLVQYMAYIEIGDPRDLTDYPLLQFAHSKLYNTYNTVSHQYPKLQCTRVWDSGDIYSVFRELFEKK